VFVIVASVVRRSEVGAFVKYSLILAVICGIGALWEYHFHYNPFYQWAHQLLPSSLFSVPIPNASAVDELGRKLTLGPAEAGLELAAMLALALPIALVGAMQSKGRRDRILYAVAVTVLLAAGFATFKKSSLVTPVVVIATLAVFRPRTVLRLVPIMVVLFLAVHVLAPGAISGVTQQLSGSKLGSVDTTVHRSSAYDAVRPLVWTRPAFGQGYGSYEANINYILDSQILTSAIETGIVGVVAYLAMMLTVLATARPMFRDRLRNDDQAKLALALGVGAVAFFTSSFLYDAMAFPHGPYIFLVFAGLVAVLWGGSNHRAAAVQT
jgi:hypothetical protein